MKSLLKYFKGLKKECVLGPLFKLLEASFELLIPLVVSRLIDYGINCNNKSCIVRMTVYMIILGLVGFIFSVLAQFFSAKAAVTFSCRVRNALFSHIQTFSYAELDKIGSAGLINRMTSDINQLQSGVNMTLRLFLRSPFIVFGAMIMAFTINFSAALVFVVVIILLSIVVYGIMIITIPMYKKSQAGLDKVLGLTRDNLNGIRVIRAFSLEENEVENFENENKDYIKRQLAVVRISALTNPLTFMIVNFGIAYLIYTGAVKVNLGILSAGQVVALVNYMGQILIELVKLANFIVLDIKALACASRIEAVLKMDSSMKEGEWQAGMDDCENVVEFNDVVMKYNGTSEASLKNISFSAKKGEIIGVVGGTGSGKTTLINLIPRFYDAFEGSVSVDGVNVKEYSFEALRSKIGVVSQKSTLFAGTIRSNLKWGNENATDDELLEALDIARAKEFVLANEMGLDSEVCEGASNFSGGQKQRLSIARALVKKPKILLLDDSCSALDFATESELKNKLLNSDSDMVIFIAASRASSVMKADKIIVLDDGAVCGIGSHSYLMENSEVYREIYQAQYGS